MNKIYLILLTSAFLISGCYTILEHPEVSSKDENGFVYHDDVQFNDDCNSCHNSNENALSENGSVRENGSASMFRTYRAHNSESYYPYGDSYYSDNFYGDYGYYYNAPWWYEVSKSDSKDKDADSKERYSGAARGNSGSSRNTTNEREVSRTTDGGGLNYTSPTRSSTRDSGSSSDTQTGKSSTTSSENSSARSNSDQPKSRSNDGSRSSGSGRR